MFKFCVIFFSVLFMFSQTNAQDNDVSERMKKINTYVSNTKLSLPLEIYQGATWYDTKFYNPEIILFYKINTNAELNNFNPSEKRIIIGELKKRHCYERIKDICRLYSHVFDLDLNVKIIFKDITNREAFSCLITASQCSTV